MKKVSVIIPVYNTEKWVEESIISVQRGGYDNLEIIVVDDGSHDNSGVIINRLLANDPRIIYIHKKNSGAAAARESGLNVSTGEYIIFLDSDDYIEKGSIAIMVERAQATNADMVFTDAVLVYHSEPSSILVINPKKAIITDGISYLRNRLECYLCIKLFRKEVLLNVKQQHSPVCEDLFMMVQVLPRCKRIEYIDKPLYYYRQTEDSIMRASRERTVGEWVNHALQMHQLLPTLSLPKDINDIFFYENIHTIHRFLKDGNRRDVNYMTMVRKLIKISFKELRISTINSTHRLKLSLYIIVINIIYGK